ncbi:MAG: PQQ-binding-like beta-propeller repeat protein [Planctomycetales bacterium]
MPDRLSDPVQVKWRIPLSGDGVGGIAATRRFVIVSDRELDDSVDVFRCLKTENGDEVWALRYPTNGKLDFGNSPRGTPLIVGDTVALCGAHGDVNVVKLETGEILWTKQLRTEFEMTAKLPWGFCASPLLSGNHLILNPGGRKGFLAACSLATGDTAWSSPGTAASYGSFLEGVFGGKRQIVGYDADSLGGWDPATGKRLWRLKPPKANDFNVPTPLAVGDMLLVTTENNGTRLYGFDPHGVIIPEPLAHQRDLAPDTHTPVAIGRKVFGVWNDLYCLDAGQKLKTLWTGAHPGFTNYASLIASEHRLLATTMEGEILLIDATGDKFKLLGEWKVFEDERGVYSHPAARRLEALSPRHEFPRLPGPGPQ